MRYPPAPWHLPLGRPPRIIWTGVGVFGSSRKATFGPDSHWSVILYDYHADLWFDELRQDVRPGYVSIKPPNVMPTYIFRGRSEHSCAHFIWPNEAEETWSIPSMQDMNHDIRRIRGLFGTVMAASPACSQRAEAALWELLWALVPQQRDSRSRKVVLHPAVAEAVRLIDLGLDQPLRVSELSTRVGLSHNQLTRQFKAELNTTVVAYIRRRRAVRARDLLTGSELSIKEVASAVGVPGLRQFNRLIHDHFVMSPRDLRAESV